MNNSYDFSREKLLASVQEAEELAERIDALGEGHPPMRLIYRWAEVADGVAKLMVLAEELLPEDELLELQNTVNKQDEKCWETYRRNMRWLNRPGG